MKQQPAAMYMTPPPAAAAAAASIDGQDRYSGERWAICFGVNEEWTEFPYEKYYMLLRVAAAAAANS
jgi:hypothetical protein